MDRRINIKTTFLLKKIFAIEFNVLIQTKLSLPINHYCALGKGNTGNKVLASTQVKITQVHHKATTSVCGFHFMLTGKCTETANLHFEHRNSGF